jgi:hypothetical protein
MTEGGRVVGRSGGLAVWRSESTDVVRPSLSFDHHYTVRLPSACPPARLTARPSVRPTA